MYQKKRVCLFDPINPRYDKSLLEKGPLGGSETVFLLLAEELKKHCQLDVFFQGDRPDPEIDYDALISYRGLDPLMTVRNKKGILFCQDMPHPAFLQQISPTKVSKFVFLSHFQKEAYLSQLPDFDEGRHAIMLENGIDLSLFDSSVKKENSFIYASAPNRGLDVLLEIWAVLSQLLPDWKLKIAGSPNMYDVPGAENESRQELLSPGVDLYERAARLPNVELLGGLTYSQLVREMEKCKGLLYPSTFPETCCHVANNALHAGCVPITSKVGALSEKITDSENGISIMGDPYSDQFKSEYVHRILSAVQMGTLDRMIRTNRGMYTGYSIERQVQQLLLHMFGHDSFEGMSHRIFATCCTLHGNNKRQFSNWRWYSPLDIITDEIVGLPIDQARNAAANMAVCNGSDYLLMVDDDIQTGRDFPSQMLNLLLENDADVVVANYYYKEDFGLIPVTRVVEAATNRAILGPLPPDKEMNSDKYRFVTSGGGALLITTEALKKIGRPFFRTTNTMKGNRHTGEDSWLWQQCYLLGLKIYITDEVPILHIDRNGKAYGKPEFIEACARW